MLAMREPTPDKRHRRRPTNRTQALSLVTRVLGIFVIVARGACSQVENRFCECKKRHCHMM